MYYAFFTICNISEIKCENDNYKTGFTKNIYFKSFK